MIFISDSIHEMPQKHLLSNKTTLNSFYDILLQQAFAFLCLLLSTTEKEYTFGFNPTNSLIAAPTVSSLILPTTD